MARLADIPESSLEDALKGEPSTPAQGDKGKNPNPFLGGNPPDDDPGDNHSVGGDGPPDNGPPRGGGSGPPGGVPIWMPSPKPQKIGERHKNIPKIKHKLAKASDFAGWTKALRMCLFEYDIHPDHDYTC